ncbi:MAG: adenosylcobinamide-GDP ribazoletransferase [Firmicutes bacterium]|nr:adenosylcobinamide-GDP ribazoletransferase [Bacillota bacterium]
MIKGFFAAFAMYSKIPVPQVKWDDNTLKYALCFFPLVGAVTGGAAMLFFMLLAKTAVLRAAVMTVLPAAITGGIHLDGLMDTSDALASYQSREKKLDIMSDPHTGAFAVITLVCYLLLCFALWCEGTDNAGALCISAGFVLSRAISAFCLVLFKKAKNDGLAALFANSANKLAVGFAMAFYMVLACAFMVYVKGLTALCPIALAFAAAVVYGLAAKKNFGGVTGDTAGWFLCWCEFLILAGTILGDKIL